MLGEVTTRMRETLEVDTVLQTAVRELGNALGMAEVEVRLGGSGARGTPKDGGNGSEGVSS